MVTTTRYIYDGNQYLAEADETDTISRLYTNEPDSYTHMISQEEVSSGDTLTYHYDALGSTRTVTDEAETVTDEFTYDAWGNRLSRTGTNDIPFQYVGEHGYYREDSTESYYVMARCYNPKCISWISRDPLLYEYQNYEILFFFRNYSLFVFSNNNPLNMRDNSGYLCAPDVCDTCNSAKDPKNEDNLPPNIKDMIKCFQNDPNCNPGLECVKTCQGDQGGCTFVNEDLQPQVNLCCKPGVNVNGYHTVLAHELIHAWFLCKNKKNMVNPENKVSCQSCFENELAAYICGGSPVKTIGGLIQLAYVSCGALLGGASNPNPLPKNNNKPKASCSGSDRHPDQIDLATCKDIPVDPKRIQELSEWIVSTFGDPPSSDSKACTDIFRCKQDTPPKMNKGI